MEVYIPNSVTTIEASSYSDSPFYKCSEDLVLYVEFAETEIPSGFGKYWNYYASSSKLTVNYSQTWTFLNEDKRNYSGILIVDEFVKNKQINLSLNEVIINDKKYEDFINPIKIA